MIKLLLDTNILVDAFSAGILEILNCNLFSISNVVLFDEISKLLPYFEPSKINIIFESIKEIDLANSLCISNKRISYYDYLNYVIAKERNMTLVTGDQKLLKFAKENNVNCIGTIRLIELLIEDGLITPKDSICALELLANDRTRRIPKILVDETIQEIKKNYFQTI